MNDTPDKYHSALPRVSQRATSNFLYLNAQGLTVDKFRTLCQLLTDDTYAFIVISETWWIQWDTIASHPYHVKSSRRGSHRGHGHQNGGLMLLATPAHAQRLNVVSASEFEITFWDHSRLIRAVYLPPSLTPPTCERILTATPAPQILLGDFNVRLGQITGDVHKMRNTPLARAHVLHQAAARLGLNLVPATTGVSRTDHFFSNEPPINWTYDPAPVTSDHGAMSIPLPRLDRLPTPQTDGSTRLFLKYLNDELVKSRLLFEYDMDPLAISTFLTMLCREAHHFPIDTRQECIDLASDMITSHSLDTATAVLGSYKVNAARAWPDNIAGDVEYALDHSTAIRLYKRSLRSTRAKIAARSPTASPAEEVMAHYSTTFTAEAPKGGAAAPPTPRPAAPTPRDFETERAATQVSYWPELYRRIQTYPSAKSTGPDMLPPRLLKALADSETFAHHISTLFYLCITLGVTPHGWNDSVVTLLAKNKTGATHADETRPIASTTIFRRIFEAQVLDLWTDAPWSTLSRCQAGFRHNNSATVQALVSDESSRQGHTAAAYLDLQAAYDRVPWHRLLHILHHRKWPRWAENIVIALMFRDVRSRFAVNDQLTEPVARTRGLFQGSIISPLLFNIFFDPLLCQLDREFTYPHSIPPALAYADDLKLQARSGYDLQAMLDVCTEWASDNGMIFNPKKSATIADSEHSVSGQPLPPALSYMYLGFPTGPQGIDWNAHVATRATRATRALNHATAVGESWPPGTRLALYRAFVRPHIEYGLGAVALWLPPGTSMARQQLQEVHNRATAWIFGRLKPQNAHESMTAMGSLSFRMKEYVAGLYRHVQQTLAHNPIHTLIAATARYALQWGSLRPRQSILSRITTPPTLVQGYDRYIAQRAPDDRTAPATVKTWTVSQRLLELTKVGPDPRRPDNGTTMPALITARGRRPGSMVDQALNINDPFIRQAAIHWRENAMFVKRVCGDGHGFTRRCLRDCLGLENSAFMPTSCRNLTSDRVALRATRGTRATHYTLADHLLNRQRYLRFFRLMLTIDFLLAQSPDTSAFWQRAPAARVPPPLLPWSAGCHASFLRSTHLPPVHSSRTPTSPRPHSDSEDDEEHLVARPLNRHHRPRSHPDHNI